MRKSTPLDGSSAHLEHPLSALRKRSLDARYPARRQKRHDLIRHVIGHSGFLQAGIGGRLLNRFAELMLMRDALALAEAHPFTGPPPKIILEPSL
jgi:hypothetical protein